MPGAFRFDHAIITVDHLDSAMASYQSLGFSVYYGGRHANGTTHNALISLADGSYLELIAKTGDPAVETSAADFASFFARGEGIAGYALFANQLADEVENMRGRGLRVGALREGQRTRPDGELLRWQIAAVEESITPLLIEDFTPRIMRVMDLPERLEHANGVSGISSIRFLVNDLPAGITHYKALLGVIPLTDHTAAHFAVGTMQFVASLPENAAEARYLAHWGNAPYEITLKTNVKSAAGLLDPERTHHARLILEA